MICVHQCSSVVDRFLSGNQRILLGALSVVDPARTLVTWCLCGKSPAGSRLLQKED
jgi:hypothetical protein